MPTRLAAICAEKSPRAISGLRNRASQPPRTDSSIASSRTSATGAITRPSSARSVDRGMEPGESAPMSA